MYVENFYIGNQEYVISFRSGMHHVTEINDYDLELSKEVFSGSYDACSKYLFNRNCAFLQEQF